LLPATTNVVVTNIGQVRLLILSLYGISLTEDGLQVGMVLATISVAYLEKGTHSVLSDNTVLSRVGLNDLELDGTHTTSNKESVTLPHRSVCPGIII